MEDPSLLECLKGNAYDQFYNEHIYVFSYIAIKNLLKKYNLEVYKVNNLDIHGGSLRYFIKKTNSVNRKHKSVFSQEKKGSSRKIYADIMKYFTIIMSIIFLFVTIFYEIIKGFLGNGYHDERGFLVVSILLLANLFLGIYYNLSIWYKLTGKTKYGAYLAVFGAVITLSLNLALIPILGFVGCAWATLVCYFSMTIASYYLGKKYFYVPYHITRILLYLFVMICIYLIIYFTNLNMWINSLFLLGFVIFVYYLEKPKLVSKL